MRAQEFIVEAGMDHGIDAALRQKGYRRLGRGVDQNAYLEPGTGMILKIFRSSRSGQGEHITPGQGTFKVFADYCMANPDNQFLPDIHGWETFRFNGYIYLQIRMERLFEFDGSGQGFWADFLENLASQARFSDSPHTKELFIDTWAYNDEDNDDDTGSEMFTMLGTDGFNQLWDTIYDLSQIAKSGGFRIDLHAGNFMMGSDGHVVIADPFFLGWSHPDLKLADPWEGADDEDEDDWLGGSASNAPKVVGSMERSFHGSEDEDEDEDEIT